MFSRGYPRNLCSYIRQLVFAIFFVTFISTVILGVVFFTTINPILHGYTDIAIGNPIVSQLTGIFIWVCVLFFTIMAMIDKARLAKKYERVAKFDKLYNSWTEEQRVEYWKNQEAKKLPKQPNIVLQWIRDKHAKVCTSIEYNHEG